MATVNKTDRKKLVATQVVGETVVIFFDTRTGAEFNRLDIVSLTPTMRDKLMVYGAKQIVADIVAGVEGPDAKIKGMSKSVDALVAGQWPARASERSPEGAIAMLMSAQGCTRAAARALLGLAVENEEE